MRPPALLAVAALAIALTSSPIAPATAGDEFPAAPEPGQVGLVSVAGGGEGTGVADLPASNPSVSADGRYVAFQSMATNLLKAPGTREMQIYVRDTWTNQTELVSQFAGTPGSDRSEYPTISADGGSVVFSTTAPNLGVTFPARSIQTVVWTRSTGAIELVSARDGTAAAGNGNSHLSAISANGRLVAFMSTSTDLTSDDSHGVFQVFLRNLDDLATTLVSVDTLSATREGAKSGVSDPSISADGRYISFATEATVVATPNLGRGQVYVRDFSTGTTRLASLNQSGSAGVNQPAGESMLSGDGTKLVYTSLATDATTDSLKEGAVVFQVDLATNRTVIASRNQQGEVVGGSRPSVSSNGAIVTFITIRNAVTAGTKNRGGGDQVYARDLIAGDTVLATRPWQGGGAAAPLSGATVRAAVSANGDFVASSIPGTNLVKDVRSTDSQIFLSNVTDPVSVVRRSGADRYDVSAENSRTVFSESARLPVFIASGETYTDALSAGGAAAKVVNELGMPLLLVKKDEIPASVVAELARYSPNGVYVIGGPATISDRVVDELRSLTGAATSRISGADRYAVSAAVSADQFRSASVAYVASGEVFPDALVAGAVAGRDSAPVLLTTRDSVPTTVADELNRLMPSKIVVLGGTASVSDAVVERLKAIAPTSRIAGADRFAVAANVSASTFPEHTRAVYISSGEVFPDALSAGPAASANYGPVLLVQKDAIPASIGAELRRLDPRKIVVVGGPATVSDAVLEELRRYLRKE
ncbi:cell wall-binding repeat-containing protein [Herbiconiux sp. P18]|uniref:cell wall-binding repeat-containing protein n=1 Tax=Herbiconiux liangxiaofengii TaxID=3342795 RepID=UPI0035BAB756